MENKSKVLRVTEKEEKLINYLRVHNSAVVRELRRVLSDVGNEIFYPELKSMTVLLENKQFLDMESLIGLDFISKEDANILINSMKSNKNIIITGKIKTGKTTLLNALLYFQNDVLFTIVEHIKELKLEKDLENENVNVKICTNSSSLNNMSEVILNALKNKQDRRLVISESYIEEQLLSLLTGLKLGYSVITTSFFTEGTWKEKFIKRFDSSLIETVNEINNYNFVIVHTDIDNITGKMKVVQITEE